MAAGLNRMSASAAGRAGGRWDMTYEGAIWRLLYGAFTYNDGGNSEIYFTTCSKFRSLSSARVYDDNNRLLPLSDLSHKRGTCQ